MWARRGSRSGTGPTGRSRASVVRLDALRAAIRRRAPQGQVAPILDRLQAGVDAERAPFVRRLEQLGGRMVASWWIVNACAAEFPQGRREAVEALPGVARVEAESYVRPLAAIRASTDARNHDSDAVQAIGLRGQGATIAILDTGADAVHGTSGRPHAIYFPDGDRGRRHRLVLNRQIGRMPAEDRIGHGLRVTAVAAGGKWPSPAGDHGHAPRASIASYAIPDFGGGATTITTLVNAWQAVARDRSRYGIVVANNSYGGWPDPTHVTQQALDAVALNADVLICVPTGVLATSSQSAANGLAVAGVLPGSHVWGTSLRGPLPRDPLRSYPDLVGIDSILAPVLDDETRYVYAAGSSFASAQVAGIATLLRGAAPALSALETKAVLLASARSVARANLYAPTNNRNTYGVGLAHARRGIEVLVSRAYGRARVSRAQPVWNLGYRVAGGIGYRVAITWMRHSLATRIWSNLDVEVLDSANRRLALSVTPRNLYELAAFRAPSPGAVTIRVTAKSLDGTSQDFAWAIAAGEGPFVAGATLEYGTACRGSGLPITGGDVFPAGAATRFGYGCAGNPFDSPGLRYQQLYVTRPGTKRALFGLAFRPGVRCGSGHRLAHLTIRLGYSDKTPSTIRSVYKANWKSPPVQVFSNWVRFPARIQPNTDPRFFRPVLLFAKPWIFDPGAGNLLVEYETSRNQPPARKPYNLDTNRTQETAFVLGAASSKSGAVGRGSGLVVKLIHLGTGGELPERYASAIPFAGSRLFLILAHGRCSAPAALLWGLSRRRWGSIQLPLDLTALGAPGCKLLSAVDATMPLALDVTGQGELPLVLPPLPAIVGLQLFQQGLVFDPRANAAGLALSNGLGLLVGAQL